MPRVSGFRHDINGLRAWAVLSVVLYHFGVPPFSGGFAGVDVFFVISGYLMYGIIQPALSQQRFSIWQFYLARARRIWPALWVLCLAVLVLGWLILMPAEYRQLGKHVRESLQFTSNAEYFAEAGYFDVASQQKWLLHTWSLSVEWQFYLLFPLLLMALHRLGFKPPAVLLTLAGLLLLSYGVSIWRTSQAPDEAFFLLHTRAWEMLAGALAFHCQGYVRRSAWVARLLETLGFALILWAILGFEPTDRWPGWLAAVPVCGAVLVILARRQQSWLTANRLFQKLGTASYSIYLWHWPVVVCLAYFQRAEQPLWIALGIGLSLVLGQLSYRWIETPARQRLTAFSAPKAAWALGVCLVVTVLLAQQVRLHGFPSRLPAEVAQIEAAGRDKNPRSKECLVHEDSCLYGQGPVRAIVMGDSHADHLLAGLQEWLVADEGSILFKGVAACFVMFDVRSNHGGERCDQLNQWLSQQHQTLPEGVPLILAGIYSAYTNQSQVADKKADFYFDEQVQVFSQTYFDQFRERYLHMSCELAKERPVFVVRPTPVMPQEVPQVLGRARLLNDTPQAVGTSVADYQTQHAFILALQDEAAMQCGVQILDPLPVLCDAEFCPGARAGLPLYRDTSHLTQAASRLLTGMFEPVFASRP